MKLKILKAKNVLIYLKLRRINMINITLSKELWNEILNQLDKETLIEIANQNVTKKYKKEPPKPIPPPLFTSLF